MLTFAMVLNTIGKNVIQNTQQADNCWHFKSNREENFFLYVLVISSPEISITGIKVNSLLLKINLITEI